MNSWTGVGVAVIEAWQSYHSKAHGLIYRLTRRHPPLPSPVPADMEKFPLRMKDNDLLVTELFQDPAHDPITSLSVYMTPALCEWWVGCGSQRDSQRRGKEGPGSLFVCN